MIVERVVLLSDQELGAMHNSIYFEVHLHLTSPSSPSLSTTCSALEETNCVPLPLNNSIDFHDIERAALTSIPCAHKGRPAYGDLMLSAAGGVDPSDVGVFICGPPAMVTDVQGVAYTHGFPFHKETFLL